MQNNLIDIGKCFSPDSNSHEASFLVRKHAKVIAQNETIMTRNVSHEFYESHV